MHHGRVFFFFFDEVEYVLIDTKSNQMGTKIIKKAKLCNINMVYDAHHLILGIFHESKVHLYVVYRVNVCVQCLFYEFKFIR